MLYYDCINSIEYMPTGANGIWLRGSYKLRPYKPDPVNSGVGKGDFGFNRLFPAVF